MRDMRDMHEKSTNTRVAFFVLVLAIVVGIVSLVTVRPPIPTSMGEFFPPEEEIEYIRITAQGDLSAYRISREDADIHELVTLAGAVPMENEQKSYIGKKFEGTMYHIEMSYSKTEYDFYVVSDGTIYHTNGKYSMVKGEAQEALCSWLEVFCTPAQ